MESAASQKGDIEDGQLKQGQILSRFNQLSDEIQLATDELEEILKEMG